MRPEVARVLLTGATGGIGAAIARALVAQGAAVLLVARSADRLGRLAQDLGGDDERVAWLAVDLTRAHDLAGLTDVARDWGVNVLVNNAGLASFGAFDDQPAEHLQQLLHTNLLAPMLLTQALLPSLRAQPHAQVIQVGSVLGRLGLPGFAAYSATKFGLRGFSEALRRELAGSSVRVQYLGPRSTRTPFNDARVEAYNRATGTAMDTPERVADALLALLRSGAAERFLGFPESLAVRLNGLAPTLLDGAFDTHRRQLAPTPDLARSPS